MAVRHGCTEMLSLVAKGQDFHCLGVIAKAWHLTLGMNDITFAGTGELIAPQEEHVQQIVAFAGVGPLAAVARSLLDGRSLGSPGGAYRGPCGGAGPG